MLGIILVVLSKGEEETAELQDIEEREITSESEDYTNAVPEVPAGEKLPETTEIREATKPAGKLFIVIDDVGNNLSDLDYFLKIPVPVTFAVMPERTYSAAAAKRIREAGFDIILHQPMEPEGDQNPGTAAIFTSMGPEEIYKVLEKNMKAFPEVKGINNHMGSKATADKKVMTAVMSYLKQNGMFFLDSVTTDKSVAEEIAEAEEVPYVKRNTIFLDNDDGTAAVKKAFLSGIDVASAKGSAIMIGHVKTRALADVISELSTELGAKGFTFHGISSLFKEGGEF